MSTFRSNNFPPTFDGLLYLVEWLRGPSGCAWDRKQTSESMTKYIREECFELIDAIYKSDTQAIIEELGDVFFHLAFQLYLVVTSSEFGTKEVFKGIIKKLIDRHPHVFDEITTVNAKMIEARWQKIKRSEKSNSDSIMSGLPKTLPALSYAQLIQERAAVVGFDWDDLSDVMEKVYEELDEFQGATTQKKKESEFGDLLFSFVNLGRWLGFDAEAALRSADMRFLERFRLMERISRERDISFDGLSLNEKESLWQEVKQLLE